MTEKERLEEIKNSHLRGIHSLFGTPWVSMPKENFDWLIEQAELFQTAKELLDTAYGRVEKLEAFYDYFCNLYGQGLEVANYHLNEATEPFETFFDEAEEAMEVENDK